MSRMRSHLFVLVGAAVLALGVTPAQVRSGYEEVKDWPRLPAGMEMGEAAGVAVDADGHVLVFHRPGRGFDPTATEPLKDPAVLVFDAQDGRLLRSWGANTFVVPHGISVDRANNVFLTDVALQQVFKFSHDGQLLFAIGEPRVGRWDATHFNQPTDIAIREDGSFYVSDGYINSRVAIFRQRRQVDARVGEEGRGVRRVQQPARFVVLCRQHGCDRRRS
jgi:peptidylamidoglycolate lyase